MPINNDHRSFTMIAFPTNLIRYFHTALFAKQAGLFLGTHFYVLNLTHLKLFSNVYILKWTVPGQFFIYFPSFQTRNTIRYNKIYLELWCELTTSRTRMSEQTTMQTTKDVFKRLTTSGGQLKANVHLLQQSADSTVDLRQCRDRSFSISAEMQLSTAVSSGKCR